MDVTVAEDLLGLCDQKVHTSMCPILNSYGVTNPSVSDKLLRKFPPAYENREVLVALDLHMTSSIQRHILQKPGQFFLQKSWIHLSCKMTFEDERANRILNVTDTLRQECLLKYTHCTAGVCPKVGGGGCLPGWTPTQKSKLKKKRFCRHWYQTFNSIYTPADISHWNLLMTSRFRFWQIK
jgi:hypothetical protein